MTARPRLRAIVVGATFGAVYAEALAAPHSPVELVGLVSTGSMASAELADRLGVSLYTGLDSLAACRRRVCSGALGRGGWGRYPDLRAFACAGHPRDAGAAGACR